MHLVHADISVGYICISYEGFIMINGYLLGKYFQLAAQEKWLANRLIKYANGS